VHELVGLLRAAADPADAAVLSRYFQVKPGGYGEGDVFLGIKLGRLRQLAKPYLSTPFQAQQWLELLQSPVHEHRLVCLVVMSERARRLRRRARAGSELEHLADTYLANTAYINNWDLVDVSCGPVLGGYLLDTSAGPPDRSREVLYRLVRSQSLWERRIAVVSTFELIRAGQSTDTYALAELLLDDPHDLMHKATGWMLREAGKRVDEDELRRFLDAHAARMPRTMLRYAIERFLPDERQRYLAVKRQ
jgi:3-methyladenine DNA glycosylase AlkD